MKRPFNHTLLLSAESQISFPAIMGENTIAGGSLRRREFGLEIGEIKEPLIRPIFSHTLKTTLDFQPYVAFVEQAIQQIVPTALLEAIKQAKNSGGNLFYTPLSCRFYAWRRKIRLRHPMQMANPR
jgi:hypothetical protein